MKIRYIVISVLVGLASTSGHAAEYVCQVYCSGGTTSVVVPASSSSDAASKIDPTPVANQICKEAGKGTASSSTMRSNQCSVK
jgi:hypothetical protein